MRPRRQILRKVIRGIIGGGLPTVGFFILEPTWRTIYCCSAGTLLGIAIGLQLHMRDVYDA